jgi:hypothetical protein
MKPLIAPLASLFFMLPCLGQAQADAPQTPGPAAPATTSAPGPYTRDAPGTVCTTAARSEWFPEDEMRLLAEHRGYRIKTFKVAKNRCYEVYGFDRHGRIVEAYFNPVTTRLVRENIAR